MRLAEDFAIGFHQVFKLHMDIARSPGNSLNLA